MSVIYGSELSKKIKEELTKKIHNLSGPKPMLGVILVGDNPASQVYVRNKQKACEEVGIKSETILLPADCTQKALEEQISLLNKNPRVDGILLQLPLPDHLDARKALDLIDPSKDVDGLSSTSIAKLYTTADGFIPCTPRGIVDLLIEMTNQKFNRTDSTIEDAVMGKYVVVIGRSELVGSPIARILQNAGATVTITHSKTKNLENFCRLADILIVAVGKPKYINHNYIKPGCWVIDVGINRDENGKLCGDVDFNSCVDIVEFITPVPKGVGPMTVTELLNNTYEAHLFHI